jgi:hypothetical protein
MRKSSYYSAAALVLALSGIGFVVAAAVLYRNSGAVGTGDLIGVLLTWGASTLAWRESRRAGRERREKAAPRVNERRGKSSARRSG